MTAAPEPLATVPPISVIPAADGRGARGSRTILSTMNHFLMGGITFGLLLLALFFVTRYDPDR